MTDAIIFAALRKIVRRHSGNPLEVLIQQDVDEMNAALREARTGSPQAEGTQGLSNAASAAGGHSGAPDGQLTAKVALELISHESIVQEAYRDSVGVWTWGIGVTSRSGHAVERYKDNPQPIRKCLEIYIWLLRTRYMPDVLAEFAGHPLTEAQFAAALSFHYNTGAIRKAGWVDLWLAGNAEAARERIMDWKHPPEVEERRRKERDLFFEGKWSQDGKARVIPVAKPSYHPNFRLGQKVDVSADVAAIIGGGS